MIEIKSDKIITPNGLRSGYLYIDNGLVDGFFEKQRADIACEERYDFTGKYVSSGFIDLHTHGAGGNNPKATCDNETMSPEMLGTEGLKDFFALDENGLKFVFDLNITSAFLLTQVFAEGMVKTGGNIINISSMNAFRPLTKIPAYSAAKAGVSNFTE